MRQFKINPLPSELHAALETIARHTRSPQEAQDLVEIYIIARYDEMTAKLAMRIAGLAAAATVAADETRKGLEREHYSNPELRDSVFKLPSEDLENPLVPVGDPVELGEQR